ncbi:MAG: hypothetical protein J5594_01530 [Elusimicrobiaceae bacterium]|nr:hypothetical protein [Elusimicrobiaceae bacterium]
MKKFITYILVLAVFLTSMPIHVMAQNVDLKRFKDKNGRLQSYKPAMSFDYDYYEVGQISPFTFVEKLEEDLLNGEDAWDPSSKPRLGDDKLGTPEHLAQSYNDFLYYNIYPEESPLWNKTALIPGDGIAEEDVMDILSYHHSLSQNIAYRFRKNPEYRQEKTEKNIRLIPVYVILLATFYVSWEVAPEIVTGLIPYLSKTTKVAKVLKTITSFATMIAFDAFITDQVAWHLTQSSDRIKYLYQSIGSYTNSRINISLDTDLLKSVKETEYDRIKENFQKISKTNEEYNRGDALILKRYFKKGYAKVDQMYRPRLKQILGKFLYDLFDGDEILINEYFRKEMLRTYYALKFINDELANTEDPLRYDRAAIDLATTYKIQNIKIIDGRMIQHRKPEKKSDIEKNITSDLISALNLILEKRYVTQKLLEEHFGSSQKAISMLNMLETKGFITKEVLSSSAYMWNIDFDYVEYALKELKRNPGRAPEIISFGKNLQQIKGDYNLGKYENRDLLNYINAEIEKQLGAELADQTSVAITYPTMLTRAEVNYLVQLIDIPQKKKDHEEQMKKQIRRAKTKKWIEDKVSKRTNENLETPNWSMSK